MEHRILFGPEQINCKIKLLAEVIDDPSKDLYLVLTVLKGAAIFSSDLIRSMRTDTELEYITAKSYDKDFTPGDSLTVDNMSRIDFAGRPVLVDEDINDTHRTLQHLHGTIAKRDPESITTVALVNKTDRRETTYQPDHSGFTITSEFIYGYGLDWNQRYRNLPYIATANPPDHDDGRATNKSLRPFSSAM